MFFPSKGVETWLILGVGAESEWVCLALIALAPMWTQGGPFRLAKTSRQSTVTPLRGATNASQALSFVCAENRLGLPVLTFPAMPLCQPIGRAMPRAL
jgi:hypothetical protein